MPRAATAQVALTPKGETYAMLSKSVEALPVVQRADVERAKWEGTRTPLAWRKGFTHQELIVIDRAHRWGWRAGL